MKLRIVVCRIALIIAFPLAASCVPQSEFDQLSEDLASAQSAVEALESEVESVSTELEQATAELSKAEAQVEDLELRIQKARAQVDVIGSIFIPSLTGEIFTLSESESLALFLDWVELIEATGDVELEARFNAFIDSEFSEEALVDFFVYLIEGASQALE